jgi:hypothetical protein
VKTSQDINETKNKTEPRNEKKREGLLDVDGSREAARK